MKKRRFIACLLMAVCMVMLTASVFPHHHHFHAICLQHGGMACEAACSCCDEEACCGTEQASSLPEGCEEGCVTRFYCSMPSSGTDVPSFSSMAVFCHRLAGLLLPVVAGSSTKKVFGLYVESLHALAVRRAAGLRAPPCA